MYAGLFHYLIQTMNTLMASPVQTNLTLGALDIYGFEILATNSLEQFLINYGPFQSPLR
jgi:myosin-5